MFLAVKQAKCSRVLDRVMDMVQTILDDSVKTLVRELDFDELEKGIEPDLRALFGQKKIRRDIEALFQLTYLERTKACRAFASDREYVKHIDDGAYGLHRRSASGDGQERPLEILSRLCNDLYDIIRKGLPEKEDSFSVFLLQKEYEEANGENGRVCPVCVKENLFHLGEGEVDHYFPRKQYPALALHPYNLLPVCRDCNGPRGKHTKNPVASPDLGPGELRTVFLPYLRAGKDEIRFQVSEEPSRHIVMKPGPGGDGNTEKRIANMERLFDLGRRWSGIFSYVYEDIKEELNHAVRRGRTREEGLLFLRRTMEANARSTKGRKDFIKGVYCGWLLEKSDRELEDMFLTEWKWLDGTKIGGAASDSETFGSQAGWQRPL
ncbi:MAG: hypothetical protein HFI38_06835 [Lachnospiraceae bacterium]|jgi:5-methylcytosine-specific restriction endonuclease McrA|nr:hypothetical protein [Lachnospiraceae bacterium]